MGLETFGFISDLDAANPLGLDSKEFGDDHIRGIKSTLKSQFPNFNAAVTPTPAEINKLAGLATTKTELGLLAGRTGTLWTSTNDGAGSGLDADLLDGVQLSAIAQKSDFFTTTQSFGSLAPGTSSSIIAIATGLGTNDMDYGCTGVTVTSTTGIIIEMVGVLGYKHSMSAHGAIGGDIGCTAPATLGQVNVRARNTGSATATVVGKFWFKKNI